jgi:hypothetical protein
MPTGFWQVDVADLPEGERIESEGICWEMAWGELLRVVSDEPPEGAPTVAHLQLWGRGTHDSEEILAGFSKRQGKKFVWKEEWYRPDGWYTKAAVYKKEAAEQKKEAAEQKKEAAKRAREHELDREADSKRARVEQEAEQLKYAQLQEAEQLMLQERLAQEQLQAQEQDADEREHREQHREQLLHVHEQLKYAREDEEAALQRQRVEREEAAQVALVARRVILVKQLQEVQAQLKVQLRAAAPKQQQQRARDLQNQELKGPRQQLHKQQEQQKVQQQLMAKQQQQMASEWQEHKLWRQEWQEHKQKVQEWQQLKRKLLRHEAKLQRIQKEQEQLKVQRQSFMAEKAAELQQLKEQKAAELEQLKEIKAAELKELKEQTATEVEQLKELKEQKATEQLRANKQLEKEAAEISKLQGQRQRFMAEMEAELQGKLAAELIKQEQKAAELEQVKEKLKKEVKAVRTSLLAEWQLQKEERQQIKQEWQELEDKQMSTNGCFTCNNDGCKLKFGNRDGLNAHKSRWCRKGKQQQQQPARSNGGSDFNGVSGKEGHWTARARHSVCGDQVYIKVFHTQNGAAAAVDMVERKYILENNITRQYSFNFTEQEGKLHALAEADVEEKEAEEMHMRRNARRMVQAKYRCVARVNDLCVRADSNVYTRMDPMEDKDHARAIDDHPKRTADNEWLSNVQWEARVQHGYGSDTEDGKACLHMLAHGIIVLPDNKAKAMAQGFARDPSSIYNKTRGGRSANLALGIAQTSLLAFHEGIYALTRSFLVILDANPDFKMKDALTREDKLKELVKFYLACKTQVMANKPAFSRILNEYFFVTEDTPSAHSDSDSD